MNARVAGLHWPEYLIEAGAIGTFMLSAAGFAALLYYPASFVATGIHSELLRRGLMGLAMGLTAMAIIYSPAGQRSGAHMNPAVTLTFFRLGKVEFSDAVAYIVAQFIGAALGLTVIACALAGVVSDPSVNYVTTVPGPAGAAVFCRPTPSMIDAPANPPKKGPALPWMISIWPRPSCCT